jgi:hypothetical protein
MIRHQAKAVVRALLATYALVAANGHAQGRCPQDKRSGADATQFRVSSGTVRMPVDAFLLIRKGSQLGAIRLTSLVYNPNQAEGHSDYESFSPRTDQLRSRREQLTTRPAMS